MARRGREVVGGGGCGDDEEMEWKAEEEEENGDGWDRLTPEVSMFIDMVLAKWVQYEFDGAYEEDSLLFRTYIYLYMYIYSFIRGRWREDL